MTLHDLLRVLEARGLRLSLRLVADAPRNAVTADLRAALLEHKPHLLAELGRAAHWEALEPKGSLIEPADDGPDPYNLAEREAIQDKTPLELTKE